MLSTYNGHYRLGKNFAHLLKKDTIIHKSYGSTNDGRPDDKFKVGWWLLIFVLILSFICMSHVVFVQVYGLLYSWLAKIIWICTSTNHHHTGHNNILIHCPAIKIYLIQKCSTMCTVTHLVTYSLNFFLI